MELVLRVDQKDRQVFDRQIKIYVDKIDKIDTGCSLNIVFFLKML